jgi:hypothetical protein
MDWNRQDERTTTDFTRIEIGATGFNPNAVPFTLDPANTAVRGMPPKPVVQNDIPVMQIGYNATTQQWTVVVWTQLSETIPSEVFSEAYMLVDSTANISGLAATGLWPSDKPARPTLLTNYAGGFIDETVKASLDSPVQCVSGTAGDFDNDMDVDLYLACRSGASNIPNVLYENLGGGNFRRMTDAGGAVGPVGAAVASGAGTADSVVSADYNVDGFLDLFVTNGFNLRPLMFGGPNKLFRNLGNNGKHWIELDLVGTNSERDATGARVYATAGGVRQLRVQNGAYHRWSQDLKRSHFGLAGAEFVDLRIEWPSGNVDTFPHVAADRLYRITEGAGIVPVALGVAPAYQCGPPTLNAAVDKGVFLWRDCPTGEWRLKTAAGGGATVTSGTISSTETYASVKGIALTAADQLNYTADPKKIVFRFDTRGKSTDGVNFVPRSTANTCIKIDAPSGSKIFFGPFRKQLTPPFNLETQATCGG